MYVVMVLSYCSYLIKLSGVVEKKETNKYTYMLAHLRRYIVNPYRGTQGWMQDYI